MLKLTHDAAKLITEARTRAAMPDTYGLRLFAEPTAEGSNVAIAFAPAPERGDEVIEQDGLPVYVAPEVAEPLAAATIDVAQTPNGPDLVMKLEEEAGEMPQDGQFD